MTLPRSIARAAMAAAKRARSPRRLPVTHRVERIDGAVRETLTYRITDETARRVVIERPARTLNPTMACEDCGSAPAPDFSRARCVCGGRLALVTR